MGSVTVDMDSESGTDANMAERVIKGLHMLDTSAPTGDKPITIIMNNLGGDWYHGMGIYDAIKACKNHITIKVFGYVMSMGSIIIQAADKRIMSPNSRMMIHYGTSGYYGHNKDFIKWAKEAGLRVWGYFMLGMYGDDNGTMQKTIDLACETSPDIVNFAISAPYPNTEWGRIAESKGWLKDKRWEAYDQNYSPQVDQPNCSIELVKKTQSVS